MARQGKSLVNMRIVQVDCKWLLPTPRPLHVQVPSPGHQTKAHYPSLDLLELPAPAARVRLHTVLLHHPPWILNQPYARRSAISTLQA